MAKIEFQHTSHEGKSAVGYKISGTPDEINEFYEKSHNHLNFHQIDVNLGSNAFSSVLTNPRHFDILKNCLGHIQLENRAQADVALRERRVGMCEEQELAASIGGR